MTSAPTDRTTLPVDGVLFDVDDTLVDTREAFGRAIEAAAHVWLPGLPEERYPDALVMWRTDPSGHYRAYTRGEIDFETQRMRRANELQVAFGGDPLDHAGYAAWRTLFWDTFEASWRAHTDARVTIDALRAHGLRVGALTNAAVALQEDKLARSHLADVPVLVGLDTLGFGKPDVRVFHEACRRLGTEPTRTVYVGDELDIDAVAAVAAGLVGVWLDRTGARGLDADGWPAGVRVIERLDELSMVLGLPTAVSPPARTGR
ncbi:MAG: HAD-IA family hydrolase [Chloroflexi bacterium]|nr:HAD-IA family hydrolase [Chloroflexota bacterium]